MHRWSRALGFGALVGLILASAAPSLAIAQEKVEKVVRMGNQKVGAFALLKARGTLESG